MFYNFYTLYTFYAVYTFYTVNWLHSPMIMNMVWLQMYGSKSFELGEVLFIWCGFWILQNGLTSPII